MPACQRAKDNSTVNPQKPIGALELLSQREGGVVQVQPRGGFPCQGRQGPGSPGSCSLRAVSRSSAHPEKGAFWLAAGAAQAWALWIKGTLQGLRFDPGALCLANAGTDGITICTGCTVCTPRIHSAAQQPAAGLVGAKSREAGHGIWEERLSLRNGH